MKWIKVRFVNGAGHKGSFWVSEKNLYFDWYRNNFEVLREVEK